jgi:hypothetical protein
MVCPPSLPLSCCLLSLLPFWKLMLENFHRKAHDATRDIAASERYSSGAPGTPATDPAAADAAAALSGSTANWTKPREKVPVDPEDVELDILHGKMHVKHHEHKKAGASSNSAEIASSGSRSGASKGLSSRVGEKAGITPSSSVEIGYIQQPQPMKRKPSGSLHSTRSNRSTSIDAALHQTQTQSSLRGSPPTGILRSDASRSATAPISTSITTGAEARTSKRQRSAVKLAEEPNVYTDDNPYNLPPLAAPPLQCQPHVGAPDSTSQMEERQRYHPPTIHSIEVPPHRPLATLLAVTSM